ncbi:hypothetical protein SASPL_109544 [Salvia splendens]|uniref:Uncharacterized protein n=1 Tax=Salvia splendens TaxID=180675 RepID=A0A8X8YK67_SALSN|nr:hypothetical protein SASPL_109544 [Salvia splendens]
MSLQGCNLLHIIFTPIGTLDVPRTSINFTPCIETLESPSHSECGHWAVMLIDDDRIVHIIHPNALKTDIRNKPRWRMPKRLDPQPVLGGAYADAMARPAVDLSDVHVGYSFSYGDAVVAGGEACTGDCDGAGGLQVDAVGVGAVGLGGGVDVGDGYAVAVVDAEVELFDVDGMNVAYAQAVYEAPFPSKVPVPDMERRSSERNMIQYSMLGIYRPPSLQRLHIKDDGNGDLLLHSSDDVKRSGIELSAGDDDGEQSSVESGKKPPEKEEQGWPKGIREGITVVESASALSTFLGPKAPPIKPTSPKAEGQQEESMKAVTVRRCREKEKLRES